VVSTDHPDAGLINGRRETRRCESDGLIRSCPIHALPQRAHRCPLILVELRLRNLRLRERWLNVLRLIGQTTGEGDRSRGAPPPPPKIIEIESTIGADESGERMEADDPGATRQPFAAEL